jgi:1-aminocyclopropane-1-carboxylate deaminase
MFQLPSPIQQLQDDLFDDKKIQVFMKRDDLIHPYISGNKWRKLQGWIDTIPKGKTIVSFGGAYSNHLLALAYAGATLGYQTIGIVRGEELIENNVLFHCELFGMKLLKVSRNEYKDKDNCLLNLFGSNLDLIQAIPEGGSGPLGLVGFENMMRENNMKADYYICPAGTGTTALGIHKAAKKHSFKHHVIAFACVKDKNLAQLNNPSLTVNFDFAGKGFGKFGEKEITTTQEVLKKHKLLLDPVYNAKAWQGFLSLVTQNFFNPGSKIIYLHTGGLSGWWK